jgi:hypothetical protein
MLGPTPWTVDKVIEHLPADPDCNHNFEQYTVGDDDPRVGLRGGRGVRHCVTIALGMCEEECDIQRDRSRQHSAAAADHAHASAVSASVRGSRRRAATASAPAPAPPARAPTWVPTAGAPG